MLRNCLMKFKLVERQIFTGSQLFAGKQKIERKYAALKELPRIDDILEQSQIDEAKRLEPTLVKFSNEQWYQSHQIFTNYGLDTIQFLRIITSNPNLIARSQQNVSHAFEIWRGCQFGEKFLILLLTKYPELWNVTDSNRLLKQITFLTAYLGGNKNVWKALMTNPNLLEQTERCLKEKIQYIQEVMRIELPELIKSNALSRSLDDIKCRHVFLTRLGLFTPKRLKADPNEPTKNHRLYQITDTSEKTFATKVCHVSLAEFEAFTELFARELVRKSSAEDDGEFSD